MSKVILYDYWRSTASYRVRIALNLAGISYESRIVDLVKGEQSTDEHLNRNAQGFVPVLEIDGLRLTQSLSIVEYLDETRELGLLPADAAQRARVRALAQIIACDIHPVCNLSVIEFATKNQADPEETRLTWMQHFIRRGLLAFERELAMGDLLSRADSIKPSLVDLCLIPQLYNAKRWSVYYHDLADTCEKEATFSEHEAFINASPTKT